MCGIVGIFTKNQSIQPSLGEHLSDMLLQMTDRGPDSAGVALYNEQDRVADGKIVMFSDDDSVNWTDVIRAIEGNFSVSLEHTQRHNHLLVKVKGTTSEGDLGALQQWILDQFPAVRIMSLGNTIEIYKEKGLPKNFINNFGLRQWSGSHALGHTRMATESAITTEHSHPFSTGQDLCLVHNGSLSNHNRLRDDLKKEGVVFQTDNDSEVAAGYLSWKLRQGHTLESAIQDGFEDLDGFYTLAIGSEDGFAIVRDAIACKPAVIAEHDDWVAIASEYRAIATLPDAENAVSWEPEPNRVYSWSRN